MVLVKILKRRDASSVVVAVIIAMIVGQLLMMTMVEPAAKLIGENGPFGYEDGPGWKAAYLQPIISALLQLVALEVLAWVVIGVGALIAPKTRKK